MVPLSLYIHIPFCKHRCGYCDFNTYAGVNHLIPNYIQALCREMELTRGLTPDQASVHTVFFGGGTPSLLEPDQVEEIINTIAQLYPIDTPAEISLESNPGTLTPASLEGYRRAGINRLSLGVQSIHPEELRLLDRIHGVADVTNAVNWARGRGFENINLDLIFGIPGQTLPKWQETLRYVSDLQVEHLSLYNLTIEEGTPLNAQLERGEINAPDADLAAEMYEWAMEELKSQGFIHYEISNWARQAAGKDNTCLHNRQYWHNDPYLGFGAGAHGCVNGMRSANVAAIPEYIHRCLKGASPIEGFPAAETATRISRYEEMQETMMLGLRLIKEGVQKERFLRRFGEPVDVIFGSELTELSRLGLIQVDEAIRLTQRGIMVGNQVFMRFVGD